MEGDLFGLLKVVAWVPVQGQGADDLHRGELLRNDLRRVEQINALEHLLLGVREYLNTQVPLGVGTGLDGIGEIATVEVRVHTTGDLRFLPHLGVDAETRLEVELDQGGLTGVVNHPEGVDAEALHGPEGTRDSTV